MERQALSRRLFSLSGIVPLGFFLLEHTWANASALRGQLAYVSTVEALAHVPLLPLVEIALIFVPLAYHGLYGVWMMRERIAEGASPYGHRPLVVANRLAAAIALVFIAWHVWELRVQAWRSGLSPLAYYSTLVWRLSSTWHGFPARAVLYLMGALATTFHFAVSAWGYGVTSGLFATEVQKKRAAYACVALGSVLFFVTTTTVISLATGAPMWSPRAETSTPCDPKK